MALRKVKGTLERALDKNLQDLVRGIRNHKDSEGKYISECIEEIKQELKQESSVAKANAVNKLLYLQMLGYDISWAGFNIVEVMSSGKFTHKRIGYLAASQSFHDGTDVIMLCTNLVRKDLNSTNTYDAGVALSSLSCFMTADLAHDLANDIMLLMTSTKPYLRKKSVLLMYKVFLRFPDSLKPAFARLKEKLEDPDSGVQSAAVNVICELARKNPQNYLSLAPLFFKLMTTSTNNWVLIKIIKLFGALIPLEPRLGKKLIEPLTNLIHSTSAMSLLYECINTVIAVLISISSGLQNHATSVQLCVQKLQILIEDSDQNLKYLGLLAMTKILKTHPKSVQAHKDLIMQCLDDKDESIRLRALNLLYGMVSRKNLMEIVKKLITHMQKAEGTHYRDELLNKIIGICSQNNYQYITNFEWYISVLVELATGKGMRAEHGKAVAKQLLDVAIRVRTVRSFAVGQMSLLLRNCSQVAAGARQAGLVEVLYAAAWICGEFADCLADTGDIEATLDSMLLPYAAKLPAEVQAAFVHNSLKLYARLLAEARASGASRLTRSLCERLEVFVHSSELEVQERAASAQQLLRFAAREAALESRGHEQGESDTQSEGEEVGEGEGEEEEDDERRQLRQQVAAELQCLFAGELNPVAPKAQRKVPLPEGLDLEAWINKPPPEPAESELAAGQGGKKRKGDKKKSGRKVSAAAAAADADADANAEFAAAVYSSFTSFSSENAPPPQAANQPQLSDTELAQMREQRLRQQASNPNYLKPGAGFANEGEAAQDLPPVVGADPGMSQLQVQGLTSSDAYLQRHREELKAKALRRREKQRAARAGKGEEVEAAADEDEEEEGDEEARRKKKKKAKSKKLQRKRKSQLKSGADKQQLQQEDEEDEEEEEPAHAVSTTFDMPEGVGDDGEEADSDAEMAAGRRLAPDDPHRRLADIKLDDDTATRRPFVEAAGEGEGDAQAAAAGAAAEKSDRRKKEKKEKRKKKSKKREEAAEGEEAKARKKGRQKGKQQDDLMLLNFDDDSATPAEVGEASARWWLPVGESSSVAVHFAWPPADEEGDAARLVLRVRNKGEAAITGLELVDVHDAARRQLVEACSQQKPLQPGCFLTCPLLLLEGEGEGEGELLEVRQLSLELSPSGAELELRLGASRSLRPQRMQLSEMKSAIASGQASHLASAKLAGLSFDLALAKLSCAFAPVDTVPGTAATMHARCGDASVFLLLKSLGEGDGVALEAKCSSHAIVRAVIHDLAKLLPLAVSD